MKSTRPSACNPPLVIRLQPLVLDEESGQKVPILFTSPERAREFVRDFPGYGGGLLTEFKWITEKVGVGYSIPINPGHELGIDLEVGLLQVAGKAAH